ncbi:Peroxin 13, N-terminal region-domain-containing protein [Lactifluus subvellereus]|nr:Peroxin 13, N-terminal region-domain-containing protein [Lactifluus subvellereus]
MGSPPKPWERSGTIAAAASTAPAPAVSTSHSAQPLTATPTPTPANSTATATNSTTTPPSVPPRPASFAHPTTSTTPSPFASPFSSPFNRFGAPAYSPYGSSMYGGMGSLGGFGGYGYGSYGMNGGMNGMYGGGAYGGMGMYGQPGMPPFGPANPSVTQALESTTATTFALLHSVVQTFAGLAQMLESTFVATHSSFFALAGVVDQFAQLRNALGSVLGLFSLLRWMRDLLTGRRSSTGGEMRGEFREFLNGRPVQGPAAAAASQSPPRNASKKPLVIFFLAFLGIPYAMHKLVKILADRAAEQQRQQGQVQGQGQGGQGQDVVLPNGQVLPPLGPSQLAFARTAYPFQASSPAELGLHENEIVAIMGKLDPTTGMEVDPRMEVETEWWKGRTREGREGWFPRKFVQLLERKTQQQEAKNVE